MRSINIRQLRDTRRLKSWLRAGEMVELRERQRIVGRIVPMGESRRPAEVPDFAERRKKRFGLRRVSGSQIVVRERGRF